ncbi:molecular chaperone HtpG [Olsenella urininfantis]|uniref:molecular chaperone HtpG n=1 Tax=Olsenella urininfantis TaxID=1871033 RepID=UPI0009858FB5|nr:molecular chaperone HtpG [Olsenella urininfantis]
MKQFKTESKKLLDLMINSIYTNKEIFLRELVSNASDAIDKLSFQSLTNPELAPGADELAIRLSFDKDARTITVSDNGIGMGEQELDQNLGTIAHSGSEQFKAENAGSQPGDIDIIGQFGVGFYSAFMVAGRVRVVSRALGASSAFVWESDGVSGYSIEPASDEDCAAVGEHGTAVTLFLRPSDEDEDTDRFLSEWGLKELVRQYSNYVRHPVQMMVTKSRQKPRPEDAPEDYKPEYEDYEELETINSMTPIWKRRASEVEQKDYDEFYQSSFHDWVAPARTIGFHAEGALSYDALLFIPAQQPFDLYSKDFEKGLALYSSNVLIQEKCADLLPDYLSFVRGVVDSPDVTLNISRETLQQNSQLRAIARRVEKKVLSELKSMRDNDRDAFERFFENFGRVLKFGIYNSFGSKSDLADLLLFWSAREGRMLTLAEYAQGMPEGQDKIYYAAGESRERMEQVPAVRAALDHGFDVLLCTQDVDEFMLQALRSWHDEGTSGDSEGDGREPRDLELQNVSSADLDLASDEEKKEAERATADHRELFEALKSSLGEKVGSVRVAAGLGDAPASLAAEGPVSLEMERVMSQGPEADRAPKAQRVLQLNAAHPVFAKLVAAQEAGDEERLDLYASLLFDQALLVEGLQVDDPIAFARNVTRLM